MGAHLAALEHVHIEAAVERGGGGFEADRAGADDGECVAGGGCQGSAPIEGGRVRCAALAAEPARDGTRAGPKPHPELQPARPARHRAGLVMLLATGSRAAPTPAGARSRRAR